MTCPKNGPNSLRLYAIRSAALIAVALLLFVSGRLILDYLPRFGLPPCEGPDWFFHSLRGMVGILIVIGIGLQLRFQSEPGFRRLMLATVVPLAALGVQEAASRYDLKEQRQCEARSLSQAIQACDANPAHYRILESEYGTPILSLVPPGSTGQAWNCLQDWATYQDDISLVIDKGVYRQRGN